MDDFEVRKKELLTPLLFEAGAGLWDCQGFEYGIALLLYHLARHGVAGLSVEQLSAVLDDDEKRQLVS